MTAAYVQVATDGAGKKVQTFENVISTQTVEAQAVVQVDSSGVEKTSWAVTGSVTATLAAETTKVIGTVNLAPSGQTVSTANSTSTVLTANQAFTGTSENVSAYAGVSITVFADQVSAIDGLQIQQSSNGTNWDIVDKYTLAASVGYPLYIPVCAQFLRVVYTNGAVTQTAFRLQTIYHVNPKQGTSFRATDSRLNDTSKTEALSYLMGYNGSAWDRLRSSTANGLVVDVSRVVPPTLTKATQGSTGYSTQDLKDAGRSARTFTLDSFAVSATTETLNTMSYSTDNGTATTGTSYTVTAGKRLRIQSINANIHTIAGNTTAAAVIVRIRGIATAPALVGSPLQLIMPIQGVAAANSAGVPADISIPDGWEFAAGSGIGVTTTCPGFVATTAAPKVDITITGYEY